MEKVTLVTPKSVENRNTEVLGTLAAFNEAQGFIKADRLPRKIKDGGVVSDYNQLRLVNAEGNAFYITLSKGLSAEFEANEIGIAELLSCDVHKAVKDLEGNVLETPSYWIYRPAGSMTVSTDLTTVTAVAYVPKKVVTAAAMPTADAMAILLAQMAKPQAAVA